MGHRRAVIIGAGPAGLTAAYELLKRTEAQPVVLEKSGCMGGIARTVNYKGNRIDIGGHRFFSKSSRVMQWWLNILPLQKTGLDPDSTDRVMLLRQRRSRIYYLRRFFDYPIRLTPGTLANLGAARTIRVGFSYVWSVLRPVKPERTLEDFFINRFGRELYRTFFKDYTEKVWGVACSSISAEWGAQRVKGLSIAKSIQHFLRQLLRGRSDISQKGTETSLIEQFLYPKHGPGQMWEEVAARVAEKGGEVLTGWEVTAIHAAGGRVEAVTALHSGTGEVRRFEGDLFFSTMPVRDLVRALDADVPPAMREISEGLQYRDFITVGLLVERLKVAEPDGGLIRDNWIYIQEPDVLVGRMQIFNNWSPYLVADPGKVWIGLEYFCFESGSLWRTPDAELVDLAKREMEKIGILDPAAVLDAMVIRVPKTYPAYFGSYPRFGELRQYLDGFENLFLLGRNGMHRYNNMDHSMLAAMVAVDNIVQGVGAKDNIWAVNTEEEYHEEKQAPGNNS
jgi:protoporphyrinogen oxidase